MLKCGIWRIFRRSQVSSRGIFSAFGSSPRWDSLHVFVSHPLHRAHTGWVKDCENVIKHSLATLEESSTMRFLPFFFFDWQLNSSLQLNSSKERKFKQKCLSKALTANQKEMGGEEGEKNWMKNTFPLSACRHIGPKGWEWKNKLFLFSLVVDVYVSWTPHFSYSLFTHCCLLLFTKTHRSHCQSTRGRRRHGWVESSLQNDGLICSSQQKRIYSPTRNSTAESRRRLLKICAKSRRRSEIRLKQTRLVRSNEMENFSSFFFLSSSVH